MRDVEGSAGSHAGGSLRGVRVVEFGHYIAAPLTGVLLADQGADVVKVERPGGDPARRMPGFSYWNRGKRSVVLDLKSPEGAAAAADLTSEADIVLENMRPGVADRLGIGYDALSAARPELVYCSMPGFGPGHALRDEPGWEGLVGALTGLYQSPDARQSDGRAADPQYTSLAVPSSFSAMLAAVSIAMALNVRDRTGVGQRIEAPLHSAMFTAMGRLLLDFDTFRPGTTFDWARTVMSRQYRCADGRYVQLHGMWWRFVEQTLLAAGRPDWLPDARAAYGQRVDHASLAAWVDRFDGLFAQRTAQDWEDRVEQAGGAATFSRSTDEWLSNVHARQSGMVIEVPDPHRGSTLQPGVQVCLSRTPGSVRSGPPALGQHSVGSADGVWPRPPTHPAGGGEALTTRALQGMRVLDLCIVLAGPSCGRVLAEFGADVIKIDDPLRESDPVQYVDVNRGKRSIQLDLRTPEGRSRFWALVETADVVLENFRDGALDRLGIGYKHVRARKPSVVYVSMNCFGHGGPWQRRPGWEQSAQAATGMQLRHGAPGGEPLLVHYPVSDYGTGLAAAFGVALALIERRRDGQGQRVTTSLAHTAGLLQGQHFVGAPDPASELVEGPSCRGPSSRSRLWQAADGWMFVHAADDAAYARVMSLLPSTRTGSDELDPRDSEGRVASRLEAVFLGETRDHWLARLRDLGVPAAANMGVVDVRADAYASGAGLVRTREHPGRGTVTHLGTTVGLSRTPLLIGEPAPLPGGQTSVILAELDGELRTEGIAVVAGDEPDVPRRDAGAGSALTADASWAPASRAGAGARPGPVGRSAAG